MRDADGVGELHLALMGEAGRDDVLGDPARGIRGGSVDLGAVLAGEGAAAMATHAAVGVDDDLAAGETGVAHRAADDKAAGGVDVNVRIAPGDVDLGENRGDDVLDDVGLDDVHALDVRVMLGGDDDGVSTSTGRSFS